LIDLSVAIPRAHPGFEGTLRTADALRRSLAAVLDVTATPRGSYEAALVLLASVETPHNVDRIARLLGLPREFVARCGRRLCDNGVWAGGKVFCSWTYPDAAGSAFWADVTVAEGRLCRRVEEESGELQWAEPGVWHKNYSLMDPKADLRTSVSYEVPLPAGDGNRESPAAEADCDDRSVLSWAPLDETGETSIPADAAVASVPAWLPMDSVPGERVASEGSATAAFSIIGNTTGAHWMIDQTPTPAAAPVSPSRFPDAVWIGSV
jgi:hypothetical protein